MGTKTNKDYDTNGDIMEFIVMSALKLKADLNKSIENNEKINFHYSDDVNIQFGEINILNLTFNKYLWILHGFNKINGGKISVTDCYGIDKDNEIHFPSTVPENNTIKYYFKDTKELTSIRQNIYVDNIKNFNGFNMDYSLKHNKYKFIFQRLKILDSTSNLSIPLSGITVRTKSIDSIRQNYSGIPHILYDFEALYSNDEKTLITTNILNNESKVRIIFEPDPSPQPKKKINIIEVLKLLAIIYLISDDDEEFLDLISLLIIQYYDIAKELYYHVPKKYFAYIDYIFMLYLTSSGKYLI